ncbi:MAG: hypothetical protein ACYC4P_03475 [Thermoanaerobaculia bacterium]
MTERRPRNPGLSDVHDPGIDGSGDGAHESLPPFTFRHRIIPAVHAVVAERFDGSDPGLAAVYAAVTARSSNAVLPGELPYSVLAGSVFIRLDGEEELVVGPGSGAGSGRPFHAWAGRRHPSGRTEVADLSTRHLNAWLDLPGLPRFPRAVWAFEDEAPRAFRYAASAEATERVRESLRTSREEAVVGAARAVVERLRASAG